MNLSQIEKTAVEKIQEQELVDLAVGLGSVTAPSGYKQPLADYVEDWNGNGNQSLETGEFYYW